MPANLKITDLTPAIQKKTTPIGIPADAQAASGKSAIGNDGNTKGQKKTNMDDEGKGNTGNQTRAKRPYKGTGRPPGRPRKVLPPSGPLSVDEYRLILADIARNPNASDATRIKCIETDSKLVGNFGLIEERETQQAGATIPQPGSPEWSALLNASRQAREAKETETETDSNA